MNRKLFVFLLLAAAALFSAAGSILLTSGDQAAEEYLFSGREAVSHAPMLGGAYSSLSVTYGDSLVLPCLQEIKASRAFTVTVSDGTVLKKEADGTVLTAVKTGRAKVTAMFTNPDESFTYAVQVLSSPLTVTVTGSTQWNGSACRKSVHVLVEGWKRTDSPKSYVNYKPPEAALILTENTVPGTYPAEADFSAAVLPSGSDGRSNYHWDEEVHGTYRITGQYAQAVPPSAEPKPSAASEPAASPEPAVTTEPAASPEPAVTSEPAAASESEAEPADREAPEIILEGVGDRSTNGSPIFPSVRIADAKPDPERSAVVLTGEKTAEKRASFSENTDGSVTFGFGKVTADDHYTLKVSAFDRTGNRAEKEFRFTVNRKGCTFTCPEGQRDAAVAEDFQPSVRIDDLDTVQILSAAINGAEVPYHFSEGFLTIEAENTVPGKNRLTLICRDAAGNRCAMEPWEFFRGDLPAADEYVIISNVTAAPVSKGNEMNNSGNRKLFAMMIIVGVLILACIGTLIGMKLGTQRRQEIEQAKLESADAASQALASSREALAQSAADVSASAVSAEAAASKQAAQDAATDLLAEQTKESNRENSEILKGIVSAGVPNVSAYADAKKNAETVSAQTVSAQTVSQPASSEASKTTGTNGHIVCIDAGHQTHTSDSQMEANGPGSSDMKLAVSSGTYGNASGLEEYELNLEVALKLQAQLESRGYQVVMTRTTNDVSLTNIDRAEIANNAGADIMVRIHANGADDTDSQGALTYAPDTDNAYLSQSLISESNRLAADVINSFCASTGAKNLGVLQDNTMTGINWSKVPVTYVEMGFMSNTEEDLRMATDSYQDQMAAGIADGIDAYFAGN